MHSNYSTGSLQLYWEVYEYLEELDQMNWSARGNVLNQYLRNTSIGTTLRTANQGRVTVNSHALSSRLKYSLELSSGRLEICIDVALTAGQTRMRVEKREFE